MFRFVRGLYGRFRHLKQGTLARALYVLTFVIIGITATLHYFIAGQAPLGGYFVASLITCAAIYTLLMIVSFVNESDVYRSNMARGRGGSARFAGAASSVRHNWRMLPKNAPIFLGETTSKYDPTPLRQSIGVNDENHLVTIAQPGAGKSTTVIWPNLISHPYPDSIFVLDPKGEHAQHTSAPRSKLGPVFILDPQNQTNGLPTVRFNPLDEIDIKAGDAKERLNELGEAMYVSSGSKNEHPHFKDICIAMIAGLCAHIKSWPTYPPDMQNLPGVYDLIMKGGLGNPDPKQAAKSFEILLNDMALNPAAGEAPMEAVRVLRAAGGNELGSIFTTLIRCIRWVSSSNMRAHLQRSDFSLSELRKQVCSVYVVLDFADMAPEKQGRYMRVLLSMAMDRARKTPLPPERSERRTLFILDEVGMLGKMPTIERNYKILRGAHVKLWSFFQEFETVTQTFDNAEALMAASTKQFFGVSDTTTAEKIEKYLGKFLDVRRSGGGTGEGKYEQTKALLSADEITDTLRQKSMAQIVITGGGAKFFLRRITCFPPSTPATVPNPVQTTHTAPRATKTPQPQQHRPQAPTTQTRRKPPPSAHSTAKPAKMPRAPRQQTAAGNTATSTKAAQYSPADVSQALALFGLPQSASVRDVDKRMKLLEGKAKHSTDYAQKIRYAHKVLSATQQS